MSVEISLGNTTAQLKASDPGVYISVDEFLSFFSKTAPYQNSYKLYLRDREKARRQGRKPLGWNGIVKLLDQADYSFPSGLVPRVVEFLEEQGDEVELIDNRHRPEPHPMLLDGELVGEARDWQQDALKASQRSVRGVFEAATGAGKTNLMAQVIVDQKQPSLVLVNRSTLAKQTVARFKEIIRFPHVKNPFGIIGDGIWEPGLITVATYQTLHSMLDSHRTEMLDWLRQFTAIHPDEAHHVPARTFYALSNATEEAYYRYGYSATPFKGDKETEFKLVGVCGEIIHSYTAKDAIADKILTPPRIYVVDASFDRLKPVDPITDEFLGNFAKEYKDGIVDHRERNKLLANIAEICAEEKLPTLVFVRRQAQGQVLERLIDESEFIYGNATTAIREDAKKRLASGELPVLIASTIFNEGEDIPAIGVIVIGGGYQASNLSLQTVGRGLRTSEDKDFVLVFDIWDGHSNRLLKHSKSRVKTWRDAGFEVHVVSIDDLEGLMEREGFFR